jgi:hypothetical protein
MKLYGQNLWGAGSDDQVFVCNCVLDFVSIDELIDVSNQLVHLVCVLGADQDVTAEIND